MNKPLLTGTIAGLLVCAAVRCEAADDATAYTALRVMGKSLGGDTINRVVEVTGRGGAPQPQTWRIIILDGARGAREVKVAHGQVVSQNVVAPTSLKAIKLPDLNLDSSGAFDAADKEARRAKVPFTAIDYALRVSATSGKPVWNLELFNADHARVGEVRFAAHDGNLIAVTGLTPGQQPASTPRALASSRDADHDTVRPTHVTPSGPGTTTTTTTTTYDTARTGPPPDNEDDVRRDSSSSNEGGFFSRAGRTLDHTTDAVGDSLSRTGQAVNRTMHHTSAKIQRFFTGDSNSGGSNN